MFPPKMKHPFQPSMNSSNEDGLPICVHCGYSEKSHTDQATCEACGSITECGFFPDHKHPKKMLICFACYDKEMKIAVRESEERAKKFKMAEIKSPGQYFVADDIPAIKLIVDSVHSDSTVLDEDKTSRICELVKERIINCQKEILDYNDKVRTAQRNENEARIYLNYKMKELSEQAQRKLGLENINYKPTSPKSPKTSSIPKIKSGKLDMMELKKVANMYNIPVDALRIICVARGISIKDAVDVYLKLNPPNAVIAR